MEFVSLQRSDGELVCEQCLVASSPWTRMRGLLGRKELPRGEGMLLRPAASVHTAFMRFAIDVVFLDAELRVVRIERQVPPWRMVGKRGAKCVVELPAGECSRRNLEVGDEVALVQPEPQSSRAWGVSLLNGKPI